MASAQDRHIISIDTCINSEYKLKYMYCGSELHFKGQSPQVILAFLALKNDGGLKT